MAGGPLGALAGFVFGSLFDTDSNDAGSYYGEAPTHGTTYTGQRNSFLFSMLVMASYIIRADGRIMHSEMEFVRRFLRSTFGEAAVGEGERILLNLFEQRKQMDRQNPLASIAYGIAYPFGVIGVILFVKLLPRIMRIDLDKEARRLEKERRSQFPELTTCLFRVTNPAVFDRSLMQINARAMTGAVISRHKHNEQIAIPTAQTILHEGDYIQAVGSEEALNQLAVLVGEREEGELPLVDMQEIESLLLTKKDMINKQLGDLNLMKNFGCTVTRIRRSGIDLSPSPDLALKFGDKLMVVGEKDGIKGVARLLGNDTKQLSDTDFFPIALGIVLGVLFGKLNISFSDSLSFSPGLTGGILMVALFLSAIGKTGPILWSMSGPANQLLRQLGLLLFLAEVGTSAGRNLMATFQESGWLLFGVGAAITLVPMLVAVCVGLFVFKINILDLLGTITGGMTSTPGLAAADSMTDSNIPSVAYATVYPIAMVFLILIIQVIASAVY